MPLAPRPPSPLSVTLVALLSGFSLACSGFGGCPEATHVGRVDASDIDAVDDGDGVLSDEECWELCWDTADSITGEGDTGWLSESQQIACEVVPDGDAFGVTCTSSTACDGGRGHACLQLLPARPCDDPLGAWLAEMALNEQGSVIAFRELARELRQLGAPAALVERALQAAGEERRHGRVLRRLARARGASVLRPRRQRIADATC